MGLTQFCCCCDLRRGCIAFTWIQLMYISMAIASLAIPLPILNNPYYKIDPYTGPAIYSMLNILIAEQVIKGFTCVALIWGLIKKQHLLYQPWLFVYGIECAILTLLILITFIAGFFQPAIFGAFVVLMPIVGLSWYFWFCIHTVYAEDFKNTTVSFIENYQNLLYNPNVEGNPC